MAWDRVTGKPLHNAIVWHDSRTADIVSKKKDEMKDEGTEALRQRSGLPINTYFSAVKMRWLLENVDAVKEASESTDNRLCLSTIDTWLIAVSILPSISILHSSICFNLYISLCVETLWSGQRGD